MLRINPVLRPQANRALLVKDEPTAPRLPYPNGWYRVCVSDELPIGAVLTRRFMGEDIVIYRTSSGAVLAVEAHCPHLGAHLGHGGRVDGECIVCPFHNFAFDDTGTCVRTGYGTPPPPNATLVGLETREIDGMVVVWYHAEKKAPTWEIRPRSTGRVRGWVHRSDVIVDHPQDIVENSVDVGHFGPIHRTRVENLKADAEGPIFRVETDLCPGSATEPSFLVLGGHLTIVAQGLGWSIGEVSFPKIQLVLAVSITPTPIDPVRIDFKLALRVEKFLWFDPAAAEPGRVGRLLFGAFTRLIFYGLIADARRDYKVWQNKIYLERPKLAKGDGPIMVFRKWASQFYDGTN